MVDEAVWTDAVCDEESAGGAEAPPNRAFRRNGICIATATMMFVVTIITLPEIDESNSTYIF